MIDWNSRRGVVTRREADELLGRRAVLAGLASGVLTQPWRGVVVHAAASLDLATRARAAVLATDTTAVLSGTTSVALHGISAIDSAEIHITVPPERKIKSKSGLVVHRGELAPTDVIELDGLRVCAVDLALADLLCTGDKHMAFAALDEALGELVPDHRWRLRENVRDRLDERPSKRGIHRARTLLDLATGLAASPPESVLRLIVVEAGFPIPEAQYEITTIDGRKLYVLDLAWPSCRIALEYDGFAAHEERHGYDLERDARMAGRGWVTIRASAADLRDPRRMLRALGAVFEQRGHKIA
ncbi:DUF559 domain-containing protein [Amycolatopsis sp. NPDC059027]|uniref:DUF559 domain-containing protein n=1 Tax=unclassified Amycolatopsis TaxID=2618356 RepID=UPI00366C5708